MISFFEKYQKIIHGLQNNFYVSLSLAEKALSLFLSQCPCTSRDGVLEGLSYVLDLLSLLCSFYLNRIHAFLILCFILLNSFLHQGLSFYPTIFSLKLAQSILSTYSTVTFCCGAT